MKAFSHILLDLYESASHTGPKQFAEELIRLVHRTITFDGAVYGVVRSIFNWLSDPRSYCKKYFAAYAFSSAI